MSHGEGVTIGMLGASFIAERMGLIMSSEEHAKHNAIVVEVLQPAITIANPDCIDEIMDKIHHDNKRGYLPEQVGAIPMILAKRCCEIHKPNELSRIRA